MQQRDIIAVIDAKKIKGIAEFQDIEILANRFPYCSTFQTLKAIGLKEQDSIEFKAQLNRASIAIQDRSKLYEYIIKDNLLRKIEESESEVIQVVKASADVEVDDSIKNIETSEIEDQDVPEKNAETKTLSESTNEAIKTNHKHFKTEALEDQIMLQAISHLSEMESDIRIAELSKEENLSKIESRSDQESISFGDWLLNKDKREKRREPIERILIDKFIDESPQISPVKKQFFSPSQMGKLSLIEDESFITETLAGIYERQGNFKKAANAYKNLGLKYPEKRLYFADLQKRAEDHLK